MSDADAEEVMEHDPVAVQEKFRKWLCLKNQGVSFNDQLLKNREFHNPNIAVKMLEFVGVNEHGTNLPSEIYDPNDFPIDADYEAIAQTQRSKWEQENNPRLPTIASPYLQVPVNHGRGRQESLASKRHQLMLERFYSRDMKK